jgi:hypothetical protein
LSERGEPVVANDHYVSRTFLQHFGDAEGRLHGYSKKKDGEYFSPWPNDVCREWDGDLNPAIEGMPEMLGEYRRLFELKWNEVVEELNKRNADRSIRLLVALCFANMVTCVPAWRRVAAEQWQNMKLAELRFKNTINQERGIKDRGLEKGVAALEEGKVKLVADPDGIKAKLTGNLMGFASLVYHSNFEFYENRTDIPFVTADNPVALKLADTFGKAMIRFMPITSKLGLVMRLDAWESRKDGFPKGLEEINKLLEDEPRGKASGYHPSPTEVRALNRLMVQCAEDQVFSCRKDEGIEALVAKYGKYRIESTPREYRESATSLIHGFVIEVRPRSD